MKKFLSILLSLIMIMSLLPITAFAVELKHVDITITAPKVGAHPSFNAKVGDGYKINSDSLDIPGGIAWLDVTQNRELKSSDLFQEGHEYVLGIALKTIDGNIFQYSSDRETVLAEAYLNSVRAEVAAPPNDMAKDGRAVMVVMKRYFFPKTQTPSDVKLVETVTVGGIQPPVAGQICDSSAVVAKDEPYTVFGELEWYDETDKKFLPRNSVFLEGHVYSVNATLEIKSGHEFASSATAYNMTGTINGMEAKLSKAYEYQRWARVVVSYTFPAVTVGKKITRITITDIVEPKIGRQSIARAHYLKYSEGVEGIEAMWYEDYNYTNFFGLFSAGKSYMFMVLMKPKEGYEFARKANGAFDVIVTFNGKVVGYVDNDGEGNLSARMDYGNLGPAKEQIGGVISYQIKEPVIGEKPSFKAENQREDGLYYIDTVDPNSTKYGITWYEGVGGARKMDENDTFKAGEYYYVAIKVKPIDGYQFDTDSNGDLLVRGAINGNMSIIGGNEEGLFIGYTFPLLEETKKQPQAPETTIENKFVDVKPEDWFYNDVMSAVKLGLINGKTDTEYKPYDNLTYAEAIKLAACMHQLYADGAVTLKNGTVNWYDTYVAYCVDNGIIDKEYKYDDYATRSGYMVIFANALPDEALEKINNVPDGSIPDVPMTRAYSKAVYKLYRAGILQGSDDAHNCKPLDNIRRSEVAAILSRMMDKTKRVKFSMDA